MHIIYYTYYINFFKKTLTLDKRTSLAVETLLSLGRHGWCPPSPASSTDMECTSSVPSSMSESTEEEESKIEQETNSVSCLHCYRLFISCVLSYTIHPRAIIILILYN